MPPPAPIIISVAAEPFSQTNLSITIEGSGFGITETYLAAAEPSSGVQFEYGPRLIVEPEPNPDGFPVQTVTRSIITAVNVAPGTSYTFTVQAIDGDGVLSSPSDPSSPFTTFGLIIANNVVLGFTGTFPENLVIPEGVVSVANNVFANNTTLKYIAFLNTIINIGISSFKDCVNLESIIFIDNFTPSVSLVIGASAFSGCINLQAVQLPYHLTEIHNSAFFQTNLATGIAIRPNVKLIETRAFANCSQLDTVVFEGSLPLFGSTTGTAISSECFLNDPITLAIVPIGGGWPDGYQIIPGLSVSPRGDPSTVSVVTPGGQTVTAEVVNVGSLAAVQSIEANRIVFTDGGTQSGTLAVTSLNTPESLATSIVTAQSSGITSILTTVALPGPDGTFTGTQRPVVATICRPIGSATVPDSGGSGSSVIVDIAGSNGGDGQPLSAVIVAPSYSGGIATCYFRVFDSTGAVITSGFSVPVTFRVETSVEFKVPQTMTFQHYDDTGQQRSIGEAQKSGPTVQVDGKQYTPYTITLRDNDGIQGMFGLDGRPSEPRNVVATSVNEGIFVSWDAPIVGQNVQYLVKPIPGSFVFNTGFARSYTLVYPHVQRGRPCTITVSAFTAETFGRYGSTPALPTPLVEVGSLPGPPTGVEAVVTTPDGDVNYVIVSWFRPALTGGADIINYTITSSPPGLTFSAHSSLTGDGTALNQSYATATGARPGTTYTFTVRATTTTGTGPPSASSSPITIFGLNIVNNILVGFAGSVPENLVIPDGVEVIANGLFINKVSIKTVKFPFSIAEIGPEAFLGTGLTTVTFPPNLVQMGYRAFANCRSLTTAIFQGIIPTFFIPAFGGYLPTNMTDSRCFEGCPLKSVTVPANAGWTSGYSVNGTISVTISNSPTVLPVLTPGGQSVNATIANVRSLAAVDAIPDNTTVIVASAGQAGTIAITSPNTPQGIASAVQTAAGNGTSAILTTPVLPGPNGTFTGTKTPVVATICVAAAGSTAVVPDSRGTESSVTVDLARSRDSNGDPIKAVIIVPSYVGSSVTCYFRVINKNNAVITSGFRVPVTFKLEFQPRAKIPNFMDIVHYDDFGNGTSLGRAERTVTESGGPKSYGFYTLVLTENDGFQGTGGEYENERTFQAFRPRSSSELLSLQKRQVEQSLNTVPTIARQDSSEQTARIRKFASVMPRMPLHGNSATMVSFKASSVVQSMVGGQAYRNAASQYRTPRQYTTPGCSNILDNFMRVDLGAPSNPKVIPCTSVISKAAPQVVPFNPVVDLPLRKNDNKVVVKSARTNTAGCGANQ